jgi:hypothetical protein
MSEKNNQENGQELEINPKRSPFTKLDNKRKNLHSLDSDREEIAPEEGGPDSEQLEQLDQQKLHRKKTRQ